MGGEESWQKLQRYILKYLPVNPVNTLCFLPWTRYCLFDADYIRYLKCVQISVNK